MERLKHYPKKIFLNTITTADAGVYLDTKEGRGYIHFKKEGLSLPGHTDINGGGAQLGAMIKSASVSYTDDGIFKGELLKFTPAAKNEDINYDFGLTFVKLVKTPGVNTFQNNRYQKTYGGTLPVVTTTNGYVDDAYVLKMEDELLSAITNDDYIHSANEDLKTNFAGSFVEAYRVYIVETTQADLSGTNVVLTYTPSDGGADVTVTLDQTTLAGNINAANTALASEPVSVVAYGATSYAFIGLTPGDNWTLVATASATLSSSTRYMYIVNKDVEVQYDVIFDKGFATSYNFGWLQFSYAASSKTEWVVNSGSTVEVLTGANAAATVTNFNSSSLATGGYAYASQQTTGVGYIDIILLDKTEMIDFDLAPIGTVALTFAGTVNYCSSTPTGKFPSLSSDEVFREVWNLTGSGSLNALQYANTPTQGAAYAKYHIKTYNTTSGQPLASELTTTYNEVIIYANKAAAQTNVWDKSEGLYGTTASAPDTTFEGLLNYWSGMPVTNW